MAKRKYWLRGIVALVLVLFGWVLYVSSKEIDRNQRIEEEVALLQSEADKIRHENKTLEERISYFASPDFQEQEAKKKLGLKKSAEQVVVIKPAPETVLPEGEVKAPEAALSPDAPDTAKYQKWLRLFTHS